MTLISFEAALMLGSVVLMRADLSIHNVIRSLLNNI